MEKQKIADQNMINALTPQKETLTVTAHVATLSVQVGLISLVEATTGSSTGSKLVVVQAAPATGEVKLDRTAGTLTFNATDAVTQCYVEYLEAVDE